ncbi:MAG: hypoxanthine phosphoribosyltransferase [Thermodesulfobacteriota bacterium]
MLKEINGRKTSILIEATEISLKVSELGKQITEDYADKAPLIIGILKGGFIFLADLIRSIKLETEIDFIRVSSYKDEMNPGKIELVTDLSVPIINRDVLLVEDLLDTGGTLEFIRDYIISRQPASFKICTLINKRKARKVETDLDYVGFEIEDKFIVGYGMDYAQEGRNFPDIYVVE